MFLLARLVGLVAVNLMGWWEAGVGRTVGEAAAVNGQPLRYFYRVHDNGWISMVTQRGERDFAAAVARDSQRGPTRNATDLAAAQQAADAAIPMAHVCSGRCSAWFEVADPLQRVDFTTTCPKSHSGSLSYAVGDVLFRLNTLAFWCLQCGRSWPASDEQRHHLIERVFQTISVTSTSSSPERE
jgi:hypothetical protein